MNIAIDGRPLLLSRAGVSIYTYQLITALLELRSDDSFFLYGLQGLSKYVPLSVAGGRDGLEQVLTFYKRMRVPFPFRKVSRVIFEWTSELTNDTGIQAVLWTNFMGKYSAAYKSIITIHDMAHFYFPEYTVPGYDSDLPKYLRDHAQMADLILCVSENTKKDVVKILKVPEEKVWVTYNGVSRIFCSHRDENLLNDLRKRYALPERFILFVGTIEPRKNLIKLVEACHLLYSRDQIKDPLVVVGGKGWKNESLYELIRKLNIEDRIIFTGHVSDTDLPLIYNAATVFVYPSLYEGFGMPVIEAMACGVPVVTSNVSSLPEVAGDAALLVNPQDPEDIASAIYKIMTDKGLYRNLQDRGFKQSSKFTWESCAKKTLEAISYAAGSR